MVTCVKFTSEYVAIFFTFSHEETYPYTDVEP